MRSKKPSRADMKATISRMSARIAGLQERVALLESSNNGELRRRIDELEEWKVEAEEQILELQAGLCMLQGITFISGSAFLALLGEGFLDVLQHLPSEIYIDEDKKNELDDKMGQFATNLVEAIRERE